MHCKAIGLICVIAALAAGCGPASAGSPAATNPARWAIFVPPGWHTRPFSESRNGVRTTGVQLSSVRLPAPVLQPREPAEINGQTLPPDAIGLVISTATGNNSPLASLPAPPLPLPWPDKSRGWTLGSSMGGNPISEWLWFRIGHTRYVAAITIGSQAIRAAKKTLGPVISSIKP
jgi:hypothetical protein